MVHAADKDKQEPKSPGIRQRLYTWLKEMKVSVISFIKFRKKVDTKESRGSGSLAHLVALLNSMNLAAVVFIISHKDSTQAFISSICIFILIFFIQERFIKWKELIVKENIKTFGFTHAGGIVFRQKKQDNQPGNKTQIEYLIIANKPENRVNGVKKYLFPRGHIEQNEEISQAALREVHEETGAVAQIIRPAGSYCEDPETGHRVKLYLMELLFQGTSKEDREVYWLPFEKAHAELSFPESKGMIIQAHSFLLSNTLLND